MSQRDVSVEVKIENFLKRKTIQYPEIERVVRQITKR